ncbi:MAG: gamma-glutamyl-gamma-aminobutyrate hydrolase family protein [Candidatus Nanopelagicales bacterium]|jgi:GMP synthase-like glutamine amidotransferase
MSKIAVVIANPVVGAELGHLGEWLVANDFEVRRLVRDDVLPVDAADDADLLILLGSIWTMARPMTEADDEPQAAAAISAEMALVQRWVAMDRPLFGVCFGGQLLSAALGGQVHRQSAPHIAWETPATEIDALRAPWVLLHNDAFSVPPGAQMLAEADHAPIAFRYGRAWGVQFHPEVDESILAQMFTDIDASPDISEPPLAALRSRADDQRTDSLRLFDRFWAEVGS